MPGSERQQGRIAWIADEFLGEQKVAPFSEMPLWLPIDLNGLLSLDIGKAIAAGLSFRTLSQTIVETMVWDQQRTLSGNRKPECLTSGVATHAGISRERERGILDAWCDETRLAKRA